MCVHNCLACRLTPVYAVVVAVYACLLQHVGSGPIWSTKIDREVERCVDNWWANLLYINNYVNTSAMVSAAQSILLYIRRTATACG
jgi:peptidoglycan/LPS O-acetylase OafA/YrhL